jgi:hypothetical protein
MATAVLALGAAGACPAPSAGAGVRTRGACSHVIEAFGQQTLPAASTGPFASTVTAMYGVLRRPGLPEDVPPPINPLAEDLGYRLRVYYPDEIRQLSRNADGERYFLLPAFERGYPLPPARCLPKRLRKFAAKLLAEQRKRETEPVYCIEEVGPRRPPYPGAQCQPFAAIQTGERLAETASARSEVIELVPDGVATVRLLYRGGAVVTAAATSNSYSFTPPRKLIGEVRAQLKGLLKGASHLSAGRHAALVRSFLDRARALVAKLVPRRVEWLDAGGNTVRSFTPVSRSHGGGLVGLVLAGEAEGTMVDVAFPSRRRSRRATTQPAGPTGRRAR